jgi:hypothetical protein
LPRENAEIEYLRARCVLLLNALERVDETQLLRDTRAIVNGEAANGNLCGLRIMRRALLAMSPMLSAANRDALDAALSLQERDDPVHRPR